MKMFSMLPRSIVYKNINNVFKSLGITIPEAWSSVPWKNRPTL
jgi:hypothetical protein